MAPAQRVVAPNQQSHKGILAALTGRLAQTPMSASAAISQPGTSTRPVRLATMAVLSLGGGNATALQSRGQSATPQNGAEAWPCAKAGAPSPSRCAQPGGKDRAAQA